MTDEKHRPRRWQALMSSMRRWLLRRRKILVAVMWVARLIWRVSRILLGDDPWTFYAVTGRNSHAA